MLTAKREAFCQEYLIDLNGTQAAIRAGYSERTAQEQSARLLSNVMVKERIQQLMDERAAKVGVTQERVLQEYAKLAFFDIRKIFHDDGKLKNITELDDDAAAGIAGIEHLSGMTSKIKVSDKKGALDSLARHLGMFKDKVEHSGSLSVEGLYGAIADKSDTLPEA